MNLHYSIYMQVEILLGYLTNLYVHTTDDQSTQVEILLGYLTALISSGFFVSTQVEILLDYLTVRKGLDSQDLHK